MSYGLRLRDPQTGAVRLDSSDYTVSVIEMTKIVIKGPGSIDRPGLTAAANGAFLLPAIQFATKLYGDKAFYPEGDKSDFTSSIWPFQPRIYIDKGRVSWDSEAGTDWKVSDWWLLIVRYL